MLEIYSSSIWSMLLLFQNILTSFIMYHPHCLGPYFFSLRISGLKLGIFSLKWVFLTNLSRFELSKNKGKLHWAVGRQVQCRRNISWKVNTRLVFSQRKRCTQEKCLNNMQRTIFPMSINLIQSTNPITSLINCQLRLSKAFQHIVCSFIFFIGPRSHQV